MPRDLSIKKAMVIGSGPIVIGQAAEFDYAGTQACRVLREEGVNVVLVNSNPATIMTDQAMADEIYLEPLNLDTVKRIIEKERPDSLLAGLGGQTGLTLAMQLEKEGFLAKMGCRLLGTSAEAIDRAEDRKMFKDTMDSIGQPTIPSEIANDVEHALTIAAQIGYPVIIRPAFTLGGAGGGVAYTEEELRIVAKTGLDMSPITQVLVEKYIYGWKEIEFEAMRDSAGNAIAVCSMENFDPVGVHTGDSIVVAPALTLSSKEYEMLHQASLDIISALGIVGGCNCQYALDPKSMQYAVIEVNPRVSRSSALASKATGYPIAKITAKVALGYTLDEIRNDITGMSYACSEPTVDYVVVKFPKWPFDKFAASKRTLGTQMKATGEVMSIAPSFEAAIMKAVRGAEISLDTLNAAPIDSRPLKERLGDRDDRRIFTVFEAIKAGMSDAEIFDITRIDPFFIDKLRHLAAYEARLAAEPMSDALYAEGKRLGYPDRAIARLSGTKDLPHMAASYKMVDTCAAEFPAQTPYFYSTYDSECEARAFVTGEKEKIIVLGSGPIRIGQGIEFDYSSVHCVWTLKQLGYEVVIINNNPETVSTDYDTADRLYFEPLTEEDVMNVIRVENPVGVVVAFGGQTAIKLTKFLDESGITIFGTSADGIDTAEDRERFDALLEKFNIRRPKGCGVKTLEEALAAAEELGYPVLLRPSYVIGGQNMMIVHDETEVRRYMDRILAGGIDNPVLVDKYMCGPELEVDVISDGVDVLIPGIMEHIERAGIHSGDSIAVYPPFNLTDKMMQTVVESSEKLALSLGTKGLVNIQYLIYGGELYVIEVNPRASRTVPYISKVTGVPMVDLASRVMCGAALADLGYGTGLYKTPPYCAVKVPVFSFEKLTDVNSSLGPEMKSTGEVLGVGKNIREALFKGLCAAGFKLDSPRQNPDAGIFISVDNHDLPESVGLAKKLDDLGYKLYATKDTADMIATLGIDVVTVPGVRESDEIFRLLDAGKIALVVYTGALYDSTMADYIALHRHALLCGVASMTSLDTANAFADTIASGYSVHNTELVDITRLRETRGKLRFSKMQGSGDDYIFIDNRDGAVSCPESLCVLMCDRHYGVGALGIVLIEKSAIADVKMRVFNSDGTEGQMAGNCIRCLGKYVRDHGIVTGETITVETVSGIRRMELHMRNGLVGSATVDMGKAVLETAKIPCTLDAERVIDYPVQIGGGVYRITCVNVGNPHCVVFVDRVDAVDTETIGPRFEHSPLFPERINTEFVRVVNPTTLRMRVWERGNGETMACGTGACAAVVAAVENGFCRKGEEITVKTQGGDLLVRYTDEGVTLSGKASLVYEGEIEY
ncbi:MAG: carbamoyl-phosphate synthase large subunit [Ruminococcaceae bacterium]|nr:carbamoyl-phosphate synthase large subunit [Oscillospiraceae bacterium]